MKARPVPKRGLHPNCTGVADELQKKMMRIRKIETTRKMMMTMSMVSMSMSMSMMLLLMMMIRPLSATL